MHKMYDFEHCGLEMQYIFISSFYLLEQLAPKEEFSSAQHVFPIYLSVKTRY